MNFKAVSFVFLFRVWLHHPKKSRNKRLVFINRVIIHKFIQIETSLQSSIVFGGVGKDRFSFLSVKLKHKCNIVQLVARLMLSRKEFLRFKLFEPHYRYPWERNPPIDVVIVFVRHLNQCVQIILGYSAADECFFLGHAPGVELVLWFKRCSTIHPSSLAPKIYCFFH